MPQKYGREESWKKHFEYLIPFFEDERYIKEDGKPIFVIYRPEAITINSSVSLLYQVLNLFSNFLMRTIFIIEHLNILKKANELCDYLIVGVSKDEVVQGYKNKLREVYLKRRLTWVSDAMKFLKIKKSKTVDFQKLECEELIDLI